jgi:hypothetical protein
VLKFEAQKGTFVENYLKIVTKIRHFTKTF